MIAAGQSSYHFIDFTEALLHGSDLKNVRLTCSPSAPTPISTSLPPDYKNDPELLRLVEASRRSGTLFAFRMDDINFGKLNVHVPFPANK